MITKTDFEEVPLHMYLKDNVPPNTNKDVDFEVRCEKAGGKTHSDPLDARERG